MKAIKITQNKICFVDDEDYVWLNKWKWHCTSQGYAGKNENGKILLMHRLIMKPPSHMVIDHIDKNGLNNQKKNLRICTQKQNVSHKKIQSNNTSGYKGVYWHNLGSGYWRAIISVDRKPIHLGLFKTREAAAKAYNEAAKIYYREFAELNIIYA